MYYLTIVFPSYPTVYHHDCYCYCLAVLIVYCSIDYFVLEGSLVCWQNHRCYNDCSTISDILDDDSVFFVVKRDCQVCGAISLLCVVDIGIWIVAENKDEVKHKQKKRAKKRNYCKYCQKTVRKFAFFLWDFYTVGSILDLEGRKKYSYTRKAWIGKNSVGTRKSLQKWGKKSNKNSPKNFFSTKTLIKKKIQ